MVTMIGKMGDLRHARSSVIPGTACGFKRRTTEMVDLLSSSRQIFQKGRDAGGIVRIETEHTITQNGGTFHLKKKPLV
jgi:hypothetical protein